MPSNYPGALDSFANPAGTDPRTSPDHAGQHTATNDAMEAVQGELGLDPAGDYATVRARLDALRFGQAIPYPSAFAGDSEDMSSLANWADVDAFTTKEIVGGHVLHLVTVGPSKDDRVRKTLGTTKAGAFDFRFRFAASFHSWTADKDTWFEISLSTTGGTYIATALVRALAAGGHILEVGTTGATTPTTNARLISYPGQPQVLRIHRDAGNLLNFDWGLGVAPIGLHPILDTSTDNLPLDLSSAGTVGRIDLALHTPSGPGASQHLCQAWVDSVESL